MRAVGRSLLLIPPLVMVEPKMSSRLLPTGTTSDLRLNEHRGLDITSEDDGNGDRAMAHRYTNMSRK